MGGACTVNEIPLLLTLSHLFGKVELALACHLLALTRVLPGDLVQRHCQVGSLAGAAHLLKDNTGVLRLAQREQKSLVEQKGKS